MLLPAKREPSSAVCVEVRSPQKILRGHGFELCLQGRKASKADAEAKARAVVRGIRGSETRVLLPAKWGKRRGVGTEAGGESWLSGPSVLCFELDVVTAQRGTEM